MASAVGSLLRKITRKEDDIWNVLTFDTHERQQTNFCKCNVECYAFTTQGLKEWNELYAPIPKNYTRLQPQVIPEDLEFDLVLGHNRMAHYNIAKQLSNQLHIPLVYIEHCLPVPNWPQDNILQLTNLPVDLKIYITDYNKQRWLSEDGIVINHCVDTEIFKPKEIEKQKHILTVANEYPQRDWCLGFNIYKEVTENLPTKPVGNSPGFSEAAKDLNELVNFYQESKIFLNTSTVSPIPSSMLEAAACGCAIVSTNNCATPEFFTHEYDAYLSDNPKDIKKYLEYLLDNKKECERIGQNARNTILKKCSVNRYVNQWHEVFKLL